MIQVVWLKRDIRLQDHAAFSNAAKHGTVLPIFIFEPELLDDPHYSERHWRFVSESIDSLNKTLKAFDAKVVSFKRNAIQTLQDVLAAFGPFKLWSHEEIGLDKTFIRDRMVRQWCINENIEWVEFPYSGVKRGLNHRQQWYEDWHEEIRKPVDTLSISTVQWQRFSELPNSIQVDERLPSWITSNRAFQIGGEDKAWTVMDSFLSHRGQDYSFHLSRPYESTHSCSRLSPHLAWGNISARQVFQCLENHSGQEGWQKTIRGVQSRLQWRDHFIQKFESEHEMQFRAMNRGYDDYPYLSDEHEIQRRLLAWKQGKTGFPMVDASMRALVGSGYLNFRMRAMLVSFLCHQLNLDWRLGSEHLASIFLDFEPGIQYPQIQMQAGITGINAIRLYNPTKQAIERDPEACFINRWIPELRKLPVVLQQDPSLLTEMESLMYDFSLDTDYALPVIDLKQSMEGARKHLWAYQKRPEVQNEIARVLARHTIPNRERMLVRHT